MPWLHDGSAGWQDHTGFRQSVRGVQSISDVSVLCVAAGGGPLSNAFIKFNLLDAQGNLVGNTIAHASNLAPAQAWHFNAPIAIQGVVDFKVAKVNVYRD